MKTTPSRFLAGLIGFLGVALGAFGAHALSSVLSPQGLDWWHTGVQYHLIHAVVFAFVALSFRPSRRRTLTLWAFGGGILVFSGSLYLLALTGIKTLGAITPVGGVLLLVGWGLLAFADRRNQEKNPDSP